MGHLPCSPHTLPCDSRQVKSQPGLFLSNFKPESPNLRAEAECRKSSTTTKVKCILILWQAGNNLISLTFLPLSQLKQRCLIIQDPLQLPEASNYSCKPRDETNVQHHPLGSLSLHLNRSVLLRDMQKDLSAAILGTALGRMQV